MKIFLQRTVFACFLIGVHALPCAQEIDSAARGELLYSTHCNVCHTEKIHWRDHKLAKNWAGILLQVRRWETLLGLNWSEDDVRDVAHYLNGSYYLYKKTAMGKYPEKILKQE